MNERYFMRRPDFWAGAIIILTFFSRLWFIATGQLDLVQDEAQYWDWSRTLQLSYYSKGPLIAYINRFFTDIFGSNVLGVRFGSVLNSALTQLVVYYGISRLLKKQKAALWSLVIMNTAPLFLAGSILMTTDNPLLLFWSIAFFSLYAATLKDSGDLPFWLMGVSLFLGLLSKYNMAAFVPIALAYAFLLHRQGFLARGFWPKLLLALGFGGIFGAMPILVWNYHTDWVGFKHLFYLSGVAGEGAEKLIKLHRFPEFVGSQIGLLAPWWFVFLLRGGWAALNDFRGKNGITLRLDYRTSLWLLLGFWPVWLFFTLWSFHAKVHPNWPAVSYCAGLILAALEWEKFREESSSSWAKYKNVWLYAGVVIFVVLHLQNYFNFIPDDYNPALRLKGWSDLGVKIDDMERESFETTDKVFVFSNSYDMTAALSFSVPGQARAYCVNTGRRLNQYDFWPNPDHGKKGWNAIYVLKDWRNEIESSVASLFERVGPRVEYQTVHKGQPARKFALYACYGYKGPWPEAKEEDY